MKNYHFLSSPVGRTLLFKALPVFLGIFAQIAYNLVDTFFVARLGTNELAAMSFSFPIVMIVINLIIGVGIGITSVVSRAIGEKKLDHANHLSKKGLELTILLSMLITTLGFLTMDSLFTLLGVNKELMPLTQDYMFTWYAGIIFMNLSMVGSAIFRAKGKVLFPSIMLVAGACLNAILDPILIFGWGIFPKLGIQGAALTTIIGNALSTFCIFYKLYKEEKISIPWIFRPSSCYKKILIIALPTAIASSLTPFATAVTNRMLAAYSNAAVAANSITTRLETVPFIAIFALAAVLTPFVGQNWGARQLSRIKEGIKKCFIFSYLLGAAFAVLFMTCGRALTAFFDKDPQVIAITLSYFSWIPLTYGALGTVFLTVQAMNAIGKPFLGNFLSALWLIILYLPLAYFLNTIYGFSGIFLSRFFANSFVGALALLMVYQNFFKKPHIEKVPAVD